MRKKHTKQWELQAEVNSVSEYAKQGKDTKKQERDGGDKLSGWKLECLEPKKSGKLAEEFLRVTY